MLRAERGAKALGRTERIDAGAEIEDWSRSSPARRANSRIFPPCALAFMAARLPGPGTGGTVSTISQTAPSVSPVAPPILRKA